jgi:hypothetical protein
MTADDFATFPFVRGDLDDLFELDYGEGKTSAQEAEDSAAMLGLVLVAVAAILLLVGLWLWF